MTPSELNTRTFRLRTRRQTPTIKMHYRPRYLTTKCNIGFGTRIKFGIIARYWSRYSVLTLATHYCHQNTQSRPRIFPYISASTLKVLKGSALKGGYYHKPK